eukprot:4188857-Pleurochrysis_carterae.AAC.5
MPSSGNGTSLATALGPADSTTLGVLARIFAACFATAAVADHHTLRVAIDAFGAACRRLTACTPAIPDSAAAAYQHCVHACVMRAAQKSAPQASAKVSTIVEADATAEACVSIMPSNVRGAVVAERKNHPARAGKPGDWLQQARARKCCECGRERAGGVMDG